MTDGVRNRLALANRCYFSPQEHFQSNFLILYLKRRKFYKTKQAPKYCMGQSNSYYPEEMRKWWMCSKVKFHEECVALLRAGISGGVGSTTNFTLKKNSEW